MLDTWVTTRSGRPKALEEGSHLPPLDRPASGDYIGFSQLSRTDLGNPQLITEVLHLGIASRFFHVVQLASARHGIACTDVT
jgi:hypothetical protein